MLVSQKAPSAIRCIKTLKPTKVLTSPLECQKAPSAIRCIKTLKRRSSLSSVGHSRQKAPSAIRCIKTFLSGVLVVA